MVESTSVFSAAFTHPGRKRANNEDYVTFFEPDDQNDLKQSGCLYIVADGVGGSSFGERASRYAAEKVSFEYYQHPTIEPGVRLQQAMWKAGNEIFSFADESEHLMRMATTMVACVVWGNQLIIANVGDSRAYLFRAGNLQQLTRDHSIVGEMIRNGELTEEEGMRSKIKNRITRSLGGDDDVRVDIFRFTLEPGDRLVLCSDGITRYATPADLQELLNCSTPDETTKALVDFANQNGGADNSSAIVVDYLSPLAPSARLNTDHGRAPHNVDWDTLKTEVHLQNTRRIPRNPKSIEIKIFFIGGLLILLLSVAMVSMILFAMWKKSNSIVEPSATINSNISSLLNSPTLIPSTQTLETTLSTPDTAVNDSPEGSYNQVPVVEQATPDTLQDQTESSDSTKKFCVVKIQEGDTTTNSLLKFGIDFNTEKKYMQFLSCSPPKDSYNYWECSSMVEIKDPGMIDAGQFLIIPDINQNQCNPDNGFLAIEK